MARYANKNELGIVIVAWDEESGEGSTAMYIDGQRQIYGDYYHNHIADAIDGFIDGLKFCKKRYKIRTASVPTEYDEDGDVNYCFDIPETLEELLAKHPDLVFEEAE